MSQSLQRCGQDALHPTPQDDSPVKAAPWGGLHEKLSRVRELLSGFGRVIVAFSGGVDSTLLAKLARDVLGREHALAVTADSPSMARQDLEEAKRLAVDLDLVHLVVRTREVSDSAYRANTRARCYFCKRELFEELGKLARVRHIPVVLYGAIGDDPLSERPGQQAALGYGVRAPLQDAGLAKWEVREVARSLGLPNWDRPQSACLSSRIPHGQPVTEEALGQIEHAEAFLRAQGFRQVRVRHFGVHARVEVDADEMDRFRSASLCEAVQGALGRLGFLKISVAPYRPGGADLATADGKTLWILERFTPP